MISVFPEKARTPTDVEGLGYPVIDKWCSQVKLSAALNGAYTVELVVPYKALGVKRELLPGIKQVIKLVDMDGDEEIFRVRRFKHNLKETVITAEHISYDLIDNLIEDINHVDKDGPAIMDRISRSTQYPHPFRLTSDIDKRANIRMVRMNPIQALIGTAENTFVNRLGGELKRKQFTLSMNKAIGTKRTDVIRSRRNLAGFERDIDLEDYATRIMPRAKDGVQIPEKYVDSPHIDRDHPVIKVIDYSNVEYEGEFKDLPQAEKDRVYRELRESAKADFANGRDVPNATYSVDFLTLRDTVEYADYRALEHYNLGDVVSIYEADYDVEVEAKVVSFEWDVLKKRYISMKLGGFKNGMVRNSLNQSSKLDVKIAQVEATANVALASADGKTTNFYGESEPVNPREGDMWFKKNGAEDELWQYQNVDGRLQWVYVTGSRYGKALKEAIDHQFKELDKQLKEQEGEQQKQISQALQKAGANEVLANEAKAIGSQVLTDLNRVRSNAEASQKQLASDIQATKDSIKQQAGNVTKIVTDLSNAEKELRTLKDKSTADTEKLTQDLTSTQRELQNVKAAASQAKAGLDGKVNTADFKKSQEEWSAKFSSVQVGGRNLALKTSSEWNAYINFGNSDGVNSVVNLHKVLSSGLKTGDNLHVSMEISIDDVVQHSNDTIRAIVQSYGDVTDWSSGRPFEYDLGTLNPGNNWRKVEFDVVLTDDMTLNSYWWLNVRVDGATSCKVHTKRVKIEKGTIATDWSPAPEDGELALSAVQSDFKLRADGLSAVVKSLQESARQTSTSVTKLGVDVKGVSASVQNLTTDVNNKLNQKVSSADFKVQLDGIKQNVKEVDAKTAKIAEVQTSVDGLKANVSKVQKESQDSLKAVESRFNLRADGLAGDIRGLKETDKQTSTTVANLTADLKGFSTSISNLTTDVNNKLNQKVNSADFKVQLDGIRESVRSVDNKTSKILEVERTANGIKENLARLSVGGVNRALKTSSEWNAYINFGNSDGVNSVVNLHKVLSSGLKAGDNLHVSMEVSIDDVVRHSNDSMRAVIQSYGDVTGWSSGRPFEYDLGTLNPGNNWRKVEFDVVLTDDMALNSYWWLNVRVDGATSCKVHTKRVKIEKGTIATDWSPAPEDGEADITAAKAEFTRTAEGLSAKLTAVESYVGKDGERSEALRRYSREETARQTTSLRESISSDFVRKAQHDEDVRGIRSRFSEFSKGTSGNLLKKSNVGFYMTHDKTYQLAEDLQAGQTYTLVSHYWNDDGDGHTFYDGIGPWRSLAYSSEIDSWIVQFQPAKTVPAGTWITLCAATPSNQKASMSWCTLVRGAIPMTQWSPSSADAEDTITTKLAEYNQGVDGRFATIASQLNGKVSTTDFQRVRETSQLYERIIGANEDAAKNNIARMVMTNQLFQVETAEILQSQENLVVDSKSMNQHQLHINHVGAEVGLRAPGEFRIKVQGSTGFNYTGFSLPLYLSEMKQGETYTLRFRYYVWSGAVPDKGAHVQFKDQQRNRFSYAIQFASDASPRDQWVDWHHTFTAWETNDFSNSIYPLYFFVQQNGEVWIKDVMLTRGSKLADYRPSTQDTVSQAVRTVQSQLAGSWAVKNLTSSGSVLNQLNLNRDGSVKIDGRLVQITGTTYIQDGVIQNSKIASLDAGKITAGTLDAGKIRVINLDAGSITSGTLNANFIRGGELRSQNEATNFNLNSGSIVFNNNYGSIKRVYNTSTAAITTSAYTGNFNNKDYNSINLELMATSSRLSERVGIKIVINDILELDKAGFTPFNMTMFSNSYSFKGADGQTAATLNHDKRNFSVSTSNKLFNRDFVNYFEVLNGGVVANDFILSGGRSLERAIQRIYDKLGMFWIN